MMANVTLKNVRKVYDKNVVAVEDFNLEIADKEFVVLVGPSGCGKSTTLRMIAGLEDITEGDLFIGEKHANNVAPKDRDIAMVFQNYALYPHMTVYQNMAFALRLRKVPKSEIDQKVRECAEILGITQLLSRKPKALSGGQRQRVAIGRAIVRNPQVFLMDEPLSNLDAKLRNTMRAELIKLHQRVNTTFIYVTHDQTEAMTLGDRIVIMKDGYIQQIGTPQEIFDHPRNLFVAEFIGVPQMNILPAILEIEGGKYVVHTGEAKYVLPEESQAPLKAQNCKPRDILMGIRPEHISLLPEGSVNSIKAQIDLSEMMGSEIYMHASHGGKDVVIRMQSKDYKSFTIKSKSKNDIWFAPLPNHIHIFDLETTQNLCGIDLC